MWDNDETNSDFVNAPIIFKNGGGTFWMQDLAKMLFDEPHVEHDDGCNVEFFIWYEDGDAYGDAFLTAVALYMDPEDVVSYELKAHLNSSGGLVRV